MGRKDASSRYSILSNVFEIGNDSNVDVGIVEHVILNEDDTNIIEIQSSEENPKLVSAYIGRARIRGVDDFSVNKTQLTFYTPLIPDEGIPIVGETVQLVGIAGIRYYKRIANSDLNVGNARDNAEQQLSEKTDESKGSASSYSEVSQTSTSNSPTQERESKIGEYFEPQTVHNLKLYEGDKIIQSRFGQSIRFSGYNNSENEFSPTIIIRNRENDESVNNLKRNDITEEELNKDGSIIALVSDKYKIPFQPGLIDDGGSSNFKTTPVNFKLPKEYVGQDQILINSERIILSAKSQEMIFFSKGDYGFISDGTFKIDNGEGGADLDFGGNINITSDRTNSRFYLFTGTGEIWLNTNERGQSRGTNQKEPIARAATLVDLLSKLIDAITQQVYATPAGPSAQGPLNIAAFKQIQGQLDKIKSDYNFTD